jgi:hypothetical protein
LRTLTPTRSWTSPTAARAKATTTSRTRFRFIRCVFSHVFVFQCVGGSGYTLFNGVSNRVCGRVKSVMSYAYPSVLGVGVLLSLLKSPPVFQCVGGSVTGIEPCTAHLSNVRSGLRFWSQKVHYDCCCHLLLVILFASFFFLLCLDNGPNITQRLLVV